MSLESDLPVVDPTPDTLTSSPLRWFSLGTNIVLTIAIFDRNEEHSGSHSVVGAIPLNVVVLYCLNSLIIIQCVA